MQLHGLKTCFFLYILKGNVSVEDSLFYRQPGVVPVVFYPDFQPVEFPSNPLVSDLQLLNTCDGDPFCIFDFQATGNQNIAETTMNAVDTFVADTAEIELNEGTGVMQRCTGGL